MKRGEYLAAGAFPGAIARVHTAFRPARLLVNDHDHPYVIERVAGSLCIDHVEIYNRYPLSLVGVAVTVSSTPIIIYIHGPQAVSGQRQLEVHLS